MINNRTEAEKKFSSTFPHLQNLLPYRNYTLTQNLTPLFPPPNLSTFSWPSCVFEDPHLRPLQPSHQPPFSTLQLNSILSTPSPPPLFIFLHHPFTHKINYLYHYILLNFSHIYFLNDSGCFILTCWSREACAPYFFPQKSSPHSYPLEMSSALLLDRLLPSFFFSSRTSSSWISEVRKAERFFLNRKIGYLDDVESLQKLFIFLFVGVNFQMQLVGAGV